jgi:hypothetical protein
LEGRHRDAPDRTGLIANEPSKEKPAFAGFSEVAGAGFEPATFGL